MAVSRTITRKSPSQSPSEFYRCVQSGGTHGNATYVAPEKLSSGPMKEKIMGKPELKK